MDSFEIIAAVTTSVGVLTFAVIFTILYYFYARSSIKELRTGKRDIELMDACIYEMRKSVKIRRRIGKIIKGVCFYGVLALLIPIFALSMFSKLNGNVAMINNHAMMVVASGSMSMKNEENDYLVEKGLDNQFNTYDVIILERVDANELALYDVIAFVDDTGKNVIHRIIGIQNEGGAVCYETRGDSNNTSDDFSPRAENIIGRYTNTKISSLGSVIMFFQSVGGIVTLLSLVYCLAMLDHFNGKVKAVEDERLEQLSSVLDLEELQHVKGGLRADFVETLYFKGYAYRFNEKGFLGKDQITDKTYLEKSNSAAIRVVKSNGKRAEEQIFIKTEKGDEKTP